MATATNRYELTDATVDDERRAITKHAYPSESAAAIRKMIEVAARDARIIRAADEISALVVVTV